MRAYRNPTKINGEDILAVYDERMITWLNITDPEVRTIIYRFINLENHKDTSVIDLISFCVDQNIECGITLDNTTSAETTLLSL